MATVFLAGGEFEGSSIVADAITEVHPKHTSTITSHPVESGVNISDHIFTNNVVIDIMGEFSNLPTRLVQGNLVNYQNNSRDQEAWGVLFKIYSQEQPITVVSRFQVYENCFITALTALDEVDTGETLRFSMTLEQVRFATLQERASTFSVAAQYGDQTAKKDNKGPSTDKKDFSLKRLAETVEKRLREVDLTGDGVTVFGSE